ncbi:hypothetical protein ACFX2I_031072 [Malus domestica]
MRFNILVRILVFFFLTGSLFIGIAHSQKIFDITKYGAVGDGRTDDSPAFLKSWGDICNGENDAVLTLLVTEGKTFMLQPIKFEAISAFEIHLSEQATIVLQSTAGAPFSILPTFACGPGHGISVGSLGADGATEKVDNIYVKDCSFTRTINGARIKTWQGGSGYARNITFERIKLDGAQNPIVIDQYYCNEDQNCKSQPSAWGDATYINFEGTPATEGDSVRLR